MATMNVSLPEEMKFWVESHARSGQRVLLEFVAIRAVQ